MRQPIKLATLFLCIAVSLGFQRPAPTLPSRLSDAEFWQMLTEFSEPGGAFISENYVSNELSYQMVIPELKKRLKPGGVYLGVAPEQNFTYIVALEPRIAFVIDIRRQNQLELLLYKALFEISANRAEFISRLFSRQVRPGLGTGANAADLLRLPTAADSALARSTLAEVEKNLRTRHGFDLSDDDMRQIGMVFEVFRKSGVQIDYNTGGATHIPNIPNYYDLMVATDQHRGKWSYLETEERFLYLKDLEERNLILPLVGDFGGPHAIRSVANYLRRHDAAVSVFYVSNVEDYLRNKWEVYRSNMAALPADASSVLIRFIARRSVIDGFREIPAMWPGARGNGQPPRP